MIYVHFLRILFIATFALWLRNLKEIIIAILREKMKKINNIFHSAMSLLVRFFFLGLRVQNLNGTFYLRWEKWINLTITSLSPWHYLFGVELYECKVWIEVVFRFFFVTNAISSVNLAQWKDITFIDIFIFKKKCLRIFFFFFVWIFYTVLFIHTQSKT